MTYGSVSSDGAYASVGVELDAVAVGIGDLDAHEPAVVLPFGLDHPSSAEAFARRAHGCIIRQPKAEVIRVRKLRRPALRERQLAPVV